MEEDFDLENMLDGISLTGQWQPATIADVSDPSLPSQSLDDIILGANAFSGEHPSVADDIQSALIDTSPPLFNTCPQTENSLESESITDLISSLHFEAPTHSTLEDSMEQIHISRAHTDSLTSSSCAFQVGSSPVEQKEIDNSILVRQNVHNQQRLLKTASKSRRHSGYRHASPTVAPIDVVATYGGCQPCTSAHNDTEFDYQQQLLQFDALESKQIKIKCHPRRRFHPRTLAESRSYTYYLRCEVSSDYEYPTIELPQIWASQSVVNIIQVTLLTKDKQLHPYAIDNKQCHPCFDKDALIFRENEPQTLYFRLTPEDFTKGYKSFMIEHIKSKQDEKITKELIKTHELDQSMLRFTRFFEDKSNYHRDESTVAYSCIMIEDYGDVAVEHLGPRYGPVGGNERVYALLKGRVAKDDLTVFVQEELIGWRQQISFTKSGNLVYFVMPAFPYSQFDRAVTSIIIYYKGEQLYQSSFIYKASLDLELGALSLNGSKPAAAAAGPSVFNPVDILDVISATGVRPVVLSSSKRPKRLPAGPRRV